MGKFGWALLAALSGLLSSAAVHAKPHRIHYDIRPERVAGHFTGLHVRLVLPVRPGSLHTLDVPERLTQHLAPSGFTIEGGQWQGSATPKDDRLAFKATAAQVIVTYSLLSDGAPGLKSDGQGMAIHANWFAVRGDDSLVTPEGEDRSLTTVDIAPAEGWTITSSLNGPVPLSQAGDSLFLGGTNYRTLTRDVDGARFRLAYPAALSAEAETLLDAASTVMTAERYFWQTAPAPVYIGLVELGDDADFSGRGLQGGFSLYLGDKVERTAWLRLIAHENLHNWISRRIGGFPTTDSNLEAWLNEGFTEAYTARLLLTSGLWTTQDFVDDWNTALARYGTSPVRLAPNSRILVDRQRDYDVNKLPYDRGRLLAVIWDKAFRAHTNGRVGLDDVLRAQMAEAARNDRAGRTLSADQLFPQVVRRLTGIDLSADLARDVDRGEALTLAGDAFGPCIGVGEVTQPVFDRGFDLDATFKAHGRLAGLEPGGPAERAGLREGDKLRIDETPTNDSRVTLSYRVVDGNGKSHVVRYRPEGTATVTFQQLTLKTDGAKACQIAVP